MANIGYRKINNSQRETISSWERFQAWKTQRHERIARYQNTSGALASSITGIMAAQSQSMSELAAKSAIARLVDKTA